MSLPTDALKDTYCEAETLGTLPTDVSIVVVPVIHNSAIVGNLGAAGDVVHPLNYVEAVDMNHD